MKLHHYLRKVIQKYISLNYILLIGLAILSKLEDKSCIEHIEAKKSVLELDAICS